MRLVFFDLETSGLNPERHKIAQIAAVAIHYSEHGWHEVGHFESKIKFDPTGADADALELNHYDPELWEKVGLDEQIAWGRFDMFIHKHTNLRKMSPHGVPYYVASLVGHNVNFDWLFLRKLYNGRFIAADFIPLDTLQLAKWYFITRPQAEHPADYKLQTLCDHFGVTFSGTGAHDALADVRATAEITKIIITGGT